MTPSDTNAVIKAERAWAIKAVVVLATIVSGLIVWTYLSLDAAINELQCEVRGLHEQVGEVQFTSVTARAMLENRITRLETRLDLDP